MKALVFLGIVTLASMTPQLTLVDLLGYYGVMSILTILAVMDLIHYIANVVSLVRKDTRR